MKRRTVRRVSVEAAAKINIGWTVGATRDDGFHEVSGLMQTISLLDVIEIDVEEDGDDGVRVFVPGFPDLENDDNIVAKAAAVMAEVTPPLPTTITVHKSIPVAAGLGGGSADAAATLMGLGIAWGARLPVIELRDIGAKIGSDVPGILVGGLVHSTGRGETVRRVGSFDGGWCVLGVSSIGISATDAYRAFDSLDPADAPVFHHNDLERAACAIDDALGPRIEAMRRAAGVAFVSGSGPTVVGIATTEDEANAIADAVADYFDSVEVARPIGWGVRLSVGGHPQSPRAVGK